jgi:phage terminase small subunit
MPNEGLQWRANNQMTDDKPKPKRKTSITPKQASFAQAYVECGNASEAYRKTYNCEGSSNRVVWKEASIVLANHHVTVRVAELQAKHAEKHEVTIEYLTRKYQHAMEAAYESAQFGPAVSAITQLGKLHGHFNKKMDLTMKHALGEQFEDPIHEINAKNNAKLVDHEVS